MSFYLGAIWSLSKLLNYTNIGQGKPETIFKGITMVVFQHNFTYKSKYNKPDLLALDLENDIQGKR